MQADSDAFELTECASAQDFLHCLRLSHDNWGDGESQLSNPWLFRGHWDSEWELKPPAWRNDGQRRLGPLRQRFADRAKELAEKHGEYMDHKFKTREASIEWTLQHLVEINAARDFLYMAEAQGLEVPEFKEVANYIPQVSGGNYIRERWFLEIAYSIDSTAYAEAFDSGIFETLALAQHHGIPTRLLDWTRDPRIAAFFAVADDQQDKDAPSDKIAVWAAHKTILHDTRLRTLQIPRYRNSFLHAQEGLFTYLSLHEMMPWWMSEGHWPSLLDLSKRFVSGSTRQWLRKITLPKSEADSLLALLFREHITKARLMPTYESVAKSIQTLWRLA